MKLGSSRSEAVGLPWNEGDEFLSALNCDVRLQRPGRLGCDLPPRVIPLFMLGVRLSTEPPYKAPGA